MGWQYVPPQPSRTLIRSPHRDQEGRMGRGQDGAGRWWCGGWKSKELDDHVLLLARKPAEMKNIEELPFKRFNIFEASVNINKKIYRIISY